jgi:hypothetical protein
MVVNTHTADGGRFCSLLFDGSKISNFEKDLFDGLLLLYRTVDGEVLARRVMT